MNVNQSEILRQQSANGGGDDGDDLANDSGGLVNSPDFEFDSRPQWDFRSRRQLNTANLNPSASSFSNLGFKETTFTLNDWQRTIFPVEIVENVEVWLLPSRMLTRWS